MKRDDVIRMARKWGDWNGQTVEFNYVGLELFANLVAAAEREACAKLRRSPPCEEQAMTTLRQAAEMAKSALEGWANYGQWVWPETALETCQQNTKETLAALRAALAELEQPQKARPDFLAGYDAGLADGRRCAERDAQDARDAAIVAAALAELDEVAAAVEAERKTILAEIERIRDVIKKLPRPAAPLHGVGLGRDCAHSRVTKRLGRTGHE
jgi:hypothetical protein